MIQYLINATAIWLVSLLAFELWLRKQPHHSYNRFYLLATLLAGILLPTVQWQQHVIMTGDAGGTTENALALKHALSESQGVQQVLGYEDWISLIYLAGVCIGMVLTIKEAMVLIRLYRRGRKWKHGIWTVVETGEKQGAYSAFRIIYISGKEDYNPEQLDMVLAHEVQHGHLLHMADLLLLHACRIIFWFHPLIYVYYNRLLMVHEYQADAAIAIAPPEYGRFLLEQSLLGTAPLMSHSFHRSPLPLMLICLLCFTRNSFSSGKPKMEGNKMTYKGNVFELKVFPNDTVIVQDPVTGKENMMIATREPSPIKMNGKPIYEEGDVNTPVAIKQGTVNELRAELARKFEPALRDLQNGKYIIQLLTMIIGEQGKPVYPISLSFSRPSNLDVDKATTETLRNATNTIGALLEDGSYYRPAMKDGKPVVSYSPSAIAMPYSFEVKDHVVTYVE
jgi:hypothetical protein